MKWECRNIDIEYKKFSLDLVLDFEIQMVDHNTSKSKDQRKRQKWEQNFN